MKYQVNFGILALMILFFFLAGCGSQEKEVQNAEPQVGSENVNNSVILATTTSTQDSGLLDVLVPMFEEKSGYMVKTIAVGTGKALSMGENGEADVLLVHAPDAEKVLVDNGAAVNRQLVMHNDFVIVGPKEDSAGLKGMKDAAAAFKKVFDAEALFISRGDDSGTHKKEKKFWQSQSLSPEGSWYQETGQGMGQTIRVASEKGGYTLTDRATYLALKDEIELEILVEGDESLKNIYHVMQVNPDKFEMVNGDAAKEFVDFMIEQETQETIKTYGVDKFGQPLFFPDRLE